jgi:hypothetical protein
VCSGVSYIGGFNRRRDHFYCKRTDFTHPPPIFRTFALDNHVAGD